MIDPDNILHVVQALKTNEEDMRRTEKEIRRIYSLPNPPERVIFDMSDVPLMTMAPFRKRYVELIKFAEPVRKVAQVTTNRLIWIFVSFAFNAGGHVKEATQDVRIFSTTKEAMTWLKKCI